MRLVPRSDKHSMIKIIAKITSATNLLLNVVPDPHYRYQTRQSKLLAF